MKKKKPSYRELERELNRIKADYRPVLSTFRNTAEKVLNEAIGEAAHALLGQSILEQIVKDVAYKKITAGEAKLWLETKWHKRHEYEGTYEEQCIFLGIDPPRHGREI